MTITLTAQRLKQFALDKRMCNVTDEIISMALELIGSRETIEAQATQIAEQQAVIDQRNGECDLLINELAALRANIKTAESYPDDADLMFTIDWYDDERNDGLQVAMWLKELRRRREKTAPVAVPDAITQADAPELQEIATEAERLGIKGAYGAFAVGANWMRERVLRLNSGSE